MVLCALSNGEIKHYRAIHCKIIINKYLMYLIKNNPAYLFVVYSLFYLFLIIKKYMIVNCKAHFLNTIIKHKKKKKLVRI
jgi:hypothetical protein